MRISDALSNRGIASMIEADVIGHERLGDQYYGSCVTRLTKTGFWADITDKSGIVYKLRVKRDGGKKIVEFK